MHAARICRIDDVSFRCPWQHASVHVTLQFHPDWPFRDGLVIEAMARAGVYRSQFATGTSNGGLTAYEGGDRWRWESRLFQGRYDGRDARERPVYGALNYGDRPRGGSVRFGSAHFRLRPEVSESCTFCFPDSVFEPDAVSGPDSVDDLIAVAEASEHDLLDHYIEAHVHGGVVIKRDVLRRLSLTLAIEGPPSSERPKGWNALSNGIPASRSPRHRSTRTIAARSTWLSRGR